ncbi:LysE family translocator [Halomonas sp. SpR1]|uniref:LysE family translocator n=1 Tax=Halomonas sp. SpR1 TaxID=3050462 RepID=UPI0027E3CF06|nr:LysE family translocator [Halomonas sp. SpR1]MDQ7734155.1 LysE family translocator [Halomonas sp. SpR1]
MIPLHDYLTFISIVTLIVVSPGANLFLLLQATPLQGRLTGVVMTLGFCAAIISHAMLALVGVGAIVAASVTLFTIIKFVGAAYLIWLGIKALKVALTKTPVIASQATDYRTAALTSISGRQAFVRGYLTNILNPKPAIFYFAAFPQFLSTGGTAYWLGGLGMGASHALIALFFYGIVVFTLSRVAEWLRQPRVWKSIQGLSGLVFLLIGGRLLISRSPA